MLLAQRWILATLRHRRFFSLAELNAAIRELLRPLNDRPMKKLGVSRRELFERLDQPGAAAAAADALRARGVEGLRREHRLPHRGRPQLLQRPLSAGPRSASRPGSPPRRSRSFSRAGGSRRIAGSTGRGQASTQPEHMPHAHRAHAEWTPSRLIAWAAKTGPATAQVVTDILATRPHPEQGYRACLGLLRLGKRYGPERLEAACARAAQLGASRYRTVQNILATGLDPVPLDDPPPVPLGDPAAPQPPRRHVLRRALRHRVHRSGR